MENPAYPRPYAIRFFLPRYGMTMQYLGVSSVPGEYQSDPADAPEKFPRGLGHDLMVLGWTERVSLVVSTTTDAELESLSINDFEFSFAQANVNLVRIPCEEGEAPPCDRRFAILIDRIVRRMNSKNKVVIESRQLGRAGAVAACVLLAYYEGDMLPEEAIDRVQEMFGPDACASPAQRTLVRAFARLLPDHLARRDRDREDRSLSRHYLVLQLEGETRRPAIYRFRSRSGLWSYVVKEPTVASEDSGSSDEHTEYERKEFMTDPVDTFEDALALIVPDHRILTNYLPVFIHDQYKDRVGKHLRDIDGRLSESARNLTETLPGGLPSPESWMASTLPRTELDGFFKRIELGTPTPPEQELADFCEVDFQRAPRDFLLYWNVLDVIKKASTRFSVRCVQGSFLKRAQQGDTVWIVSSDESGRLLLAGRMSIGDIVDHETAMLLLYDSQLPCGEIFGIAQYTQSTDRVVVSDIHHIAGDIRFEGFGIDALRFDGERVDPKPLREGLELTEPSAIAIADLWFSQFENGRDETFWDEVLHTKHHALEAEYWVERYQKILEDDPRDLDTMFRLAQAHGVAGRPGRAREILNEILIIDPANYKARHSLASYHYSEQRFEEFEEEMEIMVKDNAPVGEPYHQKATTAFLRGDYEEALEFIDRALEFDGRDASHWKFRGQILIEQERWEEARTALTTALEVDPLNTLALFHLSMCEEQLLNKLGEFRCLLRAAKADFDDFSVVGRLGTVYAHLDGAPEGADVEYIDYTYDYDPDEEDHVFRKGLAEVAFKRLDDARERVSELRDLESPLAGQLELFISRRAKGLTMAPVD